MKFNKLTIATFIIGSVLFAGVYAQQSQSNSNQMTTSSGKQSDKKFHIQTFPLDGAPEVKLNFIYENNALKIIRIKNIGGESKNHSIQVNILGKDYVLGLDDNVTIEPANVDKIVLRVSPYNPEKLTNVNEAFEAEKVYLFSRNDAGLYLLHTRTGQ